MNKFLISFALVLFSSTLAHSRVSFIANPSASNDDTSFGVIRNEHSGSDKEPSNEFKCSTMGYTRTRCEEGFYLSSRCPYDSRYYRTCCGNDYQLTKEDCQKKGGSPGSISCDNKYICTF